MTAKSSMAFDHHSPEYAESWRTYFDGLPGRRPVHSDAHGGFVVLSSYEDVAVAFKDDETFSSRHIPGTAFKGITIPESPQVSTPIELDPPAYLPYRKALNPWFSPARSLAYEPFTRSV